MAFLDWVVVRLRLGVDHEGAALRRDGIDGEVLFDPERGPLRVGEAGQGDVVRDDGRFRSCKPVSVRISREERRAELTHDSGMKFIEGRANVRMGAKAKVTDADVRHVKVRKVLAQGRDKIHDVVEELLVFQHVAKGR